MQRALKNAKHRKGGGTISIARSYLLPEFRKRRNTQKCQYGMKIKSVMGQPTIKLEKRQSIITKQTTTYNYNISCKILTFLFHSFLSDSSSCCSLHARNRQMSNNINTDTQPIRVYFC